MRLGKFKNDKNRYAQKNAVTLRVRGVSRVGVRVTTWWE